MPRKMTIHREGRKILLTIFLALLLFNIIIGYVIPVHGYFQIFFIMLSLISLASIAYFFRNPLRETLVDRQNIIAPADGKVVVIEEVFEGEYFKDKRLQVSIFMSPANVHVNRTPISGVVKYVKYHKGKYLVAWHPKSSEKNERNTVVIEDDEIEILIRQIAGAVARRIVNYLDVGDEVVQGNELGFIKFGSRVDIFLPLDSKIDVKLHQKVVGGETIVARFDY